MNLSLAKKFLKISIINTIRINFHYFGWKGVKNQYILCSRNVKLQNIRGGVTVKKKYRGVVRIGFGEVQGHDNRYDRNIIDIRGNVIFDGDAHFCVGAKLIVQDSATVNIGDHFIVNGKSTLLSNNKIEIGKNCLISWGCLIMDTDFHKLYQGGQWINKDQEIVIGDNCWICCNSTILKGSTIPDESVIAAGSVVTRKFDKRNTVIAGNQVKREGIFWQY